MDMSSETKPKSQHHSTHSDDDDSFEGVCEDELAPHTTATGSAAVPVSEPEKPHNTEPQQLTTTHTRALQN